MFLWLARHLRLAQSGRTRAGIRPPARAGYLVTLGIASTWRPHERPARIFVRDISQRTFSAASAGGRALIGSGLYRPLVQPNAMSSERFGRSPRRHAGRIPLAQARQ